MRCTDDGGDIVVTDGKMLKGGDERPHGMWWVVSFLPPKCEFSPLKPRTSVLPCVGYMEPSSTD